jgi:hypothetical protein
MKNLELCINIECVIIEKRRCIGKYGGCFYDSCI